MVNKIAGKMLQCDFPITLVVGNLRVVYRQSLYVVENATTEKIKRIFTDKSKAHNYAIIHSNEE